MREIKFRVWDGKKYHFPECDLDKTNHYLQIGSDGIFFLHNAEGEYITGSKDGGILEQYTGLKDKNGNEIFEGDILKCSTGIAYVVWKDAAFALKSPGSEAVDWEHSNYYKKCEVIGNIHENPELLK